jgi:hypothetical protein
VNIESYETVVYETGKSYKINQMHAHIPSTSPLLSERDLQAQIRQALNSKFTGQIQVTFLFGKTETILALHGQVRQVYIRNHRVPDLEWETPIEQFGAGTLTIETMPARALMFRKIMLEEITPARPLSASTGQLPPMIDLARMYPGPTLFHLQWEHAEAFVLVAGAHIPIRHAVLISPFETEEWSLVFEHMVEWQQEQCNVMVYRGDIKNQAWLEQHLNTLLEWYCQNVLSYYQQLTGAVMVRSILQSLSVLAENKGWDISTQDQQLRYASIFFSAAEAGHAYRDVLSAIKSRIEPIIGSSLTHYLMKQSTESTTGVYKTIGEIFWLMEGT